MTARRFSLCVLATACAVLALSVVAHRARSGGTANVLILEHQRAKLADPAQRGTQIVVLGDSASGNALDAELFSRLTGQKTQNLSLTGGYGLLGSYALLQEARRAYPELHTAIVMHTLDIWRRETSPNAFARLFSPEVDFSLVPGRADPRLERFKIETNPKELYWWARAHLADESAPGISAATGYTEQTGARYDRGEREIDPRAALLGLIHQDKLDLFAALDEMGERLGLRVVYAHAPIHEVMYRNSLPVIERIDRVILGARWTRPMTTVLHYPDATMGNSPDHVSPDHQAEVTRDYFELLQPLLEAPASGGI